MSMRSFATLAVFFLGCGGKTTQVEADGAGASGAGAAGGQGAAAAGGIGGTVTDPGACDPSSPDACDSDEYCNAPSGACGAGKCKAEPEGCFADCPGVCGCDGEAYCNVCEAQVAGVDVSDDLGCLAHRYQHRAVYWAGGLDHLIVMQADVTTGTCLRLFADAPNDFGMSVVTPSPWNVSGVAGYNSIENCLDEQQSPGDPINAFDATGTLTWDTGPSGFAPCLLDAHVSIQWDAPPTWLTNSTTIAAVNLSVDEGCF